MSKKISPRLTAVAFAAALTLAGTVEAGPLAAGTADGIEASSWSLAWDWVVEVWGDLTGLDSLTTEGLQEGTSCSNCTDDDHGWGIDPNGGAGG